MTRILIFVLIFLCGACAPLWHVPYDFVTVVYGAGRYEIMTYARLTDDTSPIHIYIEGDGNAFDAYGYPTSDPTPHGTVVRDLMVRDTSPNVAYIARPCQYIMSDLCSVSDWTDGRFSADVINAVSDTVRRVAQSRPIILIGYSGGAMVSGLIIHQNPDMDVRKWITIAGVLNHSDWTEYFGDEPLSKSLNMNVLPQVNQLHYVAEKDSVVPASLSARWVGAENIVIIKKATHDKFPEIKIDFEY